MKKKKPTKTSPTSLTERYTVGSGLTKTEKIRVIPCSETLPIIESFFRQDFTFTGRIAFAEKWAVQVLQDAKLPTDPKGLYGIPDGLPAKHIGEQIPGRTGTGTLLAIVENRGYREREHKEMYAAMILSDAVRLRNMLSRMKADPEAARKEADALAMFTFDLGLLVYEAIGFKFPYEADTLLGITDRGWRRDGGNTTGQRTHEDAVKRNSAVLRMNAELLRSHPTVRGRAREIAEKLNRPFNTIRDILKSTK